MQFIREWLLPAHSSTETDLAINRTADKERNHSIHYYKLKMNKGARPLQLPITRLQLRRTSVTSAQGNRANYLKPFARIQKHTSKALQPNSDNYFWQMFSLNMM